jgi:hypothetical protein
MSHDHKASGIAADALRWLCEAIETRAEGSDSGCDSAVDSRAIYGANTNLVRIANGWGQKYVDSTELVGEQWHAKFDEAKRIVEKSGIVVFLGARGPGKTQMAAEIVRSGSWPTDAGEWDGNRTVSHSAKPRSHASALTSLADQGGPISRIDRIQPRSHNATQLKACRQLRQSDQTIRTMISHSN